MNKNWSNYEISVFLTISLYIYMKRERERERERRERERGYIFRLCVTKSCRLRDML